MLKLPSGLPDGMIGVRAIGEVDDDCEDVLAPAIEDRLTRHDKARLLYGLGAESTGYGDGAASEDLTLGITTFNSCDRMAIVSDSESVRRTIKAFGWLIPGEVQVFHLDGIVAATVWITD